MLHKHVHRSSKPAAWARGLAGTLLAGVSLALQAQTVVPEQSVATLRVSARMVEISTVVLNRQGAPENGLTRDDFIIRQDGKEQPVRYFSAATDLPLTMALIVDTSGTQRTLIGDEWRASEVFLKQMMTRENDRSMLIQVDRRILQLAPMTSSQRALQKALGNLGHGSDQDTNFTRLYDAVYIVAAEELAREHGRKAMILLTDGNDYGSNVKIEQAIGAAQRENVSIYAIEYTDGNAPPPVAIRGGTLNEDNHPGWDALSRLAEATGGRAFQVSRKMTLTQIYSDIADDLRMQYLLGYSPPEIKKPNTFHKLEVKTRQKNVTVLARKGFVETP